MKAPKMFKTEADLCAAFIASIDDEKWTAYAETAGWDILLVRRADGFQIGIQAKQRMNTDVINQTIEVYNGWSAASPGPDCRAVLVPSSAGFGVICKYLGIVVLQPVQRLVGAFEPSLPGIQAHDFGEWPEWAPAERHSLPGYVPDVVAGASAPTQLTDWKIKALKIAVLMEKRGGVVRSDFSHLRLDVRRWIEGRWLRIEEGVLVRGDNWPEFEKAHPRVYGEIAADFDKWKPAERAIQLPLKQGALL